MASDKNLAQTYINDPLTGPDPSDETGLGSSFRPPPETPSTTTTTSATPTSSEPRRLSKTNPFRQEHGTAKEAFPTITEVSGETSYPSPPASASPRAAHQTHSPRNSIGHRQEFLSPGNRPRRSSSLKERFPGDPSVYPLEQLAREKAVADRARHATKKHAIRPDTIDSLDSAGLGHYHHEGPYDATLFARNNTWKISPVAAVASTNRETLKATPHERIVDSVKGHRPLDGVAAYPSGTTDPNGQTYNYQEGENMMTEENAGGGPYKRWSGIQYHPDDIKGKGEPSYSIEKALKEHSLHEKDGQAYGDVELQSQRRTSGSGTTGYRAETFGQSESGVRRNSSFGNKIRKRVGSLTKRNSEE